MWKDTAKYKDCKELCIIIKKKKRERLVVEPLKEISKIVQQVNRAVRRASVSPMVLGSTFRETVFPSASQAVEQGKLCGGPVTLAMCVLWFWNCRQSSYILYWKYRGHFDV